MRAAIYTRYSTDKQQSTEVQITKCREHAHVLGADVVAVYSDEATTGTNINRGDFSAMVYAAETKAFDCIIIYDITRGSRDVEDWMHFRKLMKRLDIKVISTMEQLGDIYDSNTFLTELITVGIGHHQVLQTRHKSIDGKTAKAKDALFMGGFAPLGYDIIDKKYIINETEAELVRLVFSMYAAGRSYNMIVDRLTELGARGKRGQVMGKNSLHSILTNERYIGIYSWNKYIMREMHHWAGYKPNPNKVVIEGAIPPIIDIETWEKVRRRMKDNKHNAKNKAKYSYPLSGLIVCGNCGGAYVGTNRKSSKGYVTRYYVCGNRYRTKTCKNSNYNADVLEAEVLLQIKT